MADQAREEEAIRGVVDRLSSAFSATHSPEEIAAAVAKAHATFSERPVCEFVPVLVERKARVILNESIR
ncbi:hypothetical protein GCM10022403_092540 [Streptomyces coacervatus]|uniref:Uncharacterized protein n=1 Tax=Streptomyces coacervatus TaxID=647381 RepID=A0ABP7JJV0_9ACTN|nr:hypothetical protein [Streptomyces coacervatus]MDF2273296.1 hypothetical protein [Streptomyces coacervatus]